MHLTAVTTVFIGVFTTFFTTAHFCGAAEARSGRPNAIFLYIYIYIFHFISCHTIAAGDRHIYNIYKVYSMCVCVRERESERET